MNRWEEEGGRGGGMEAETVTGLCPLVVALKRRREGGREGRRVEKGG